MTTTAASRASKYDVRREKVLDAAAAVFAERGYHGASTKLIADRVGFRQGSLYYYFDSKEQALEEVCLKGVEDFLQGLRGIVASAGPVQDKLHAAVLNHLKPVIERPDYVRTFINQRQFLPDSSRKGVGHQVREYERLIVELFRTGVREGVFDPNLDCEVAALGLIGECNAVSQWYGKRAKGKSISGIADAIASHFLIGVMR